MQPRATYLVGYWRRGRSVGPVWGGWRQSLAQWPLRPQILQWSLLLEEGAWSGWSLPREMYSTWRTLWRRPVGGMGCIWAEENGRTLDPFSSSSALRIFLASSSAKSSPMYSATVSHLFLSAILSSLFLLVRICVPCWRESSASWWRSAPTCRVALSIVAITSLFSSNCCPQPLETNEGFDFLTSGAVADSALSSQISSFVPCS